MKSSIHNISRRLANHAQWTPPAHKRSFPRHGFHTSARRLVVKPFVLADIGEGIKEVQIIQWFVQPGARIEQWDKLAEVASDKAVVEESVITSRFDGIVKKLHYEVDAMAQVGKALCDIDIQGDIDPADQKLITPDAEAPDSKQSSSRPGPEPSQQPPQPDIPDLASKRPEDGSRGSSHLATPAVRGLLKEHNLDITRIQGTGRDGRVLKEDLHNHINSQAGINGDIRTPFSKDSALSVSSTSISTSKGHDTTTPMTPIQSAMFKAMTRSASIPHFLYTDEVDLTELSSLRTKLNTSLSKQTPPAKLSYLPYIIKAVSLSIHKHPLLNATFSQPQQANGSNTPSIIYRYAHNIGIAMDTPQGLLVPVLKNVQEQSILEIAQRLSELQNLAASGSLISHPDLLSGGTITISNIGNIGGVALSPVLVEGQSAILGVGKAREVPRFDEVDTDRVVRKLVATFSWSADHRVLDGATVARFAERVAELLKEPGAMILETR